MMATPDARLRADSAPILVPSTRGDLYLINVASWSTFPSATTFATPHMKPARLVVPPLIPVATSLASHHPGIGFDVLAKLAAYPQRLRYRFHVRRLVIAQSLGGHPKRCVDIVVAGTALILLAPVMLIIASLIRLSMGGPAIFAHPRIGFGGVPFNCFKFRTMIANGDEVLADYLDKNPEAASEWQETHKLKNDPRVTPLGRLLRKTSIDELPQLLNVLFGEMSCVGPRPVVASELARYRGHARHYLRMRPGLTGVWQVNGRSATSYRLRIAMDTLYVRRWSLWRDIWLLILTVPALLRTYETS